MMLLPPLAKHHSYTCMLRRLCGTRSLYAARTRNHAHGSPLVADLDERASRHRAGAASTRPLRACVAPPRATPGGPRAQA
jgi:hypothetical protein